MAGGYPADHLTIDDLTAEVADYVARGFRFVKIAAGKLGEDTQRLRAAQAAAPDQRLSYDVHWAWRDLLEVLPVVRGWDGLELDTIEDPFPSDLSGHIAHLRAATCFLRSMSTWGRVREGPDLEMTDPARDYETLYRLFSAWVHLEGGEFVAPETPGLGVEFDWKAVEADRRTEATFSG